MALSKTLCKSTALREGLALNVLINTANVEISRDNPGMLFVTAIAGIIDTATGETQLCRAGHDAPVLSRSDEPLQFMEIEAGPPLCVIDDYRYPVARTTLQPGDLLVLLSDGVTEAQDPAENLYGRERILTYMKGLKPVKNRAERVCRGLYEDVKRFSADAVQSDDITIMAVRFR